jgi:hypothetical protein
MLVLYGRNPSYLSWLIAFEAAGLIIATRWSLIRHIVLAHCLSDGRELFGWTDIAMPYISLLGSWIPISMFSFINSQTSPAFTIYIYTIFALIYTCGIIGLYRFPLSRCTPIIFVIAICIGAIGCSFAFMFFTIPARVEPLPEPMVAAVVFMFFNIGITLFYCIWLCTNFYRKGATSWQKFVEISE